MPVLAMKPPELHVVALADGRMITVVRDDIIPGGTKARVIPVLFDSREEYVYASPCEGYAQVALAHCAKRYKKRATVFCAARQEKHDNTLAAIAAGAVVKEVRPGYLSVVRKRAQDYVLADKRRKLLPFGMDHPNIIDALADIAISLPAPKEVWTVAGSGTLTRALQKAWPAAAFFAVMIGAEPLAGRACVYEAPEPFARNAEIETPFPSCGNYDKKAWRFIVRHASDGALFWNVAG